jgi:hypothetical protein
MTTLTLSCTYNNSNVVGSDGTYLTARGTATGQYNESTIGQQLYLTSYICRRLFIQVDTSSIPAGATLTRAYLSINFISKDIDDSDFDIEVIKQDWSTQDPIDAGNMDAAYDGCLAGTKDVVWQNTAALTTGYTYYISADLDTTWINATGITYYSLRGSNDLNADVPTGSNLATLSLNGIDLVIEYTGGETPLPDPYIYVSNVAFL